MAMAQRCAHQGHPTQRAAAFGNPSFSGLALRPMHPV
jgi:hypothetical protein